jgi:hypothetical protein
MSGAAGGFLLLTALPAAADPQGHTTICHATGSDSNPYVVNNPANPGVENGHTDHQNGEDVIPAPNGAQRGPTHGSQQCEEQSTPPSPEEHGQPPVHQPPLQGAQAPVAQQHAPAPHAVPAANAPTANAPTSRPIPNAVSAGSNTAADWQLPAGGALIVLGAVGAAGALARRASARA